VTAPARLLSVRLQGFKSFAERTVVTFGPGISAVVGPNGSGKSNLADALRWSLGEQGRALRSRKAEDVIWAGSERRAAVGMADVQLTLDNADSLLPVAFEVVELGRRLFRSGENEYLLNRQRVRLRDLVDMLDAAHLAENAFLFIGQGMVDQALALRPEERRPLFEEVAGVRRHERRRRKAEDQLAESEANLARVEDVLAELRPQVRRLAVQAEQQATRASAGDDLVLALLTAAHARWHGAAEAVEAGGVAVASARRRMDAALAELSVVETAAATAAAALDARARSEAELRQLADEARAVLTAAQLEDGRLAAERDALERDRVRLADERLAAEADLAVQRRRLAEPVPERDVSVEAALSEAEGVLTAALASLAELQAADRARDADAAALDHLAATRSAEAEMARRRLAEAERRSADLAAGTTDVAERVAAAQRSQAETADALVAAIEAEAAAAAARATAEATLEQASAAAALAKERAGLAAATLAGIRARHEAAAAAIEDDRTSDFAARMRARGARRADEGLVVDPAMRAAVDAVLAEAARAYLSTRDRVAEHAGERGLAIVVDRLAPASGGEGRGGDDEAAVDVLMQHVQGRRGGRLRDALRNDGPGAASRLLARSVWLPNLQAALEIQAELPPGWVAVVQDGSAVVGEVTVRLGPVEGTLERRAEVDRTAEELRAADAAAAAAAIAVDETSTAVAVARETLDRARSAEVAATGDRRRSEESERVAARRLEAALRENAWHAAQLERLEAEVDRARSAIPEIPLEAGAPPSSAIEAALLTWQERVAELRARRDQIAAQVAEADAVRRAADRRRASAEAAIALDEARIAAADRGAVEIVTREQVLETARDVASAKLAAAAVREADARSGIAAVVAADAEDRQRLAEAERALTAGRDRLRAAEDAARAAERRDLEARLGLEGLREQLLVELAGLGELSLRHLVRVAAPIDGREDPGDARSDHLPAGSVAGEGEAGGGDAAGEDPDEGARLAAALEAAGAAWARSTPPAEPPSPNRLATLRRRYHELGAPNPFAIDEHAAARARLEELEGQHADLRAAIDRTRTLIAELDTMISEQFRTTFAALEARFDARFRQLFGGGFARLSLTDPSDLAATGVDIVARPPGKKPQALAMLSGGERALTAVALLFAMLEVRPVPFCVLDEVDAALDEANVGRFTDALRELADQTQFVVITHNRGTIEIADALYGVTVGDDSVSRVISLRLDEATELADRSREAVAVGRGGDDR
jgi:chromosome segregation protein